MFVSALKSPWVVPFGSDASPKSELGYRCLIRRVIDHYGQFQNGRRKIHGFSRYVLLNMVFINFASQARFECLILHYIVLSSVYKCWNVIFKNQSKMAARNDQENVQNFDVHIFLQIFYKHMFYHVRKPPRSVSFGSETTLEWKSYDKCLICRVINQYGRF